MIGWPHSLPDPLGGWVSPSQWHHAWTHSSSVKKLSLLQTAGAPVWLLDLAQHEHSGALREYAAGHLPPTQLAWAAQDRDELVRWVAARRMPPEQLMWATRDRSMLVRMAAADRMPTRELGWAARDRCWEVRVMAVRRMPPEELGWAAQDRDKRVREAAMGRLGLAGAETTPRPEGRPQSVTATPERLRLS